MTAGAGIARQQPRKVFDVTAVAEVATPLLDISSRNLEFTFLHQPGMKQAQLQQDVSIRWGGGRRRLNVTARRGMMHTHRYSGCSIVNAPCTLARLRRRYHAMCADSQRRCTCTWWALSSFRNVSKLPLSFSLKTSVPFSVDRTSLTLQPGEQAPLSVSFDPHFM